MVSLSSRLIRPYVAIISIIGSAYNSVAADRLDITVALFLPVIETSTQRDVASWLVTGFDVYVTFHRGTLMGYCQAAEDSCKDTRM